MYSLPHPCTSIFGYHDLPRREKPARNIHRCFKESARITTQVKEQFILTALHKFAERIMEQARRRRRKIVQSDDKNVVTSEAASFVCLPKRNLSRLQFSVNCGDVYGVPRHGNLKRFRLSCSQKR